MGVSPGDLTQAEVRLYLGIEKEILHSYVKEFLPLPANGFQDQFFDSPEGLVRTYFQFSNTILDEMATRLMIDNRRQLLFSVADLDKMKAEDEEILRLSADKKKSGLISEMSSQARYEFLKAIIPATQPDEYEQKWRIMAALSQMVQKWNVKVKDIPSRQPLCDIFVMETRSREQFIAEQVKIFDLLKSEATGAVLNPVRYLAGKIFGEHKKWSDGANAIIDQLSDAVGAIGEPIKETFTAHFEKHADRIYGLRKK